MTPNGSICAKVLPVYSLAPPSTPGAPGSRGRCTAKTSFRVALLLGVI